MNAVEISNLTKLYKDFKLDNVSFALPSGCIMGLVGENGAGKSTVIKLILGMIHKDGGKIRLFGKDNSQDIRDIKEDLGVVLDDVGIPAPLNAKQVGRIMKNTFKNWNEEQYKNNLEKLSVPINKQFKDFSRGMKMKLGIAVALSHDPKLLILDEATSGLDPVVRDEVLDIFNEFTRDENHSILISSHIVSDLEKICDYIAFLHKGKLILFEEKDILLSQYGIIHCTEQQLNGLDQSAVVRRNTSVYGSWAVVRRDRLPQSFNVSPISIEEFFVQTVKEGNQ